MKNTTPPIHPSQISPIAYIHYWAFTAPLNTVKSLNFAIYRKLRNHAIVTVKRWATTAIHVSCLCCVVALNTLIVLGAIGLLCWFV